MSLINRAVIMRHITCGVGMGMLMIGAACCVRRLFVAVHRVSMLNMIGRGCVRCCRWVRCWNDR